jgi:hypothetical protein
MLRSAASGGRTVLLHAGESRALPLQLADGGPYDIAVRYSNDGPADTVQVSVDGVPVGGFTTQDTRPPGGMPGDGWNVFLATGPLGRLLLQPGPHTVTIQVSQSDPFGVEIDQVSATPVLAGRWANFTGFAIDQGPMLVLIDNYLQHQFLANRFMSYPPVQAALRGLFPAFRAGVDIRETGAFMALTEGGTEDTFTVALATKPTEAVAITLVATDRQVSTFPRVLTFTPDNWDVPQPVTVTAADDGIAEGDRRATITAGALSNDPAYNGASGAVTVLVHDRPVPPCAQDTTGPVIVRVPVVVFGRGRAKNRVQSILLTFSEQLDPARAQDVLAYRLQVSGRGRRRHRLRMLSGVAIVYDPTTRTITLTPRRLFRDEDWVLLTVDGTTQHALTDPCGNVLDGNGDGVPGGDAIFRLRLKPRR